MMQKIILINFLLLAFLFSSASNHFDVRDFGAKGDSSTVNTSFIQQAIDSCHAEGGGTVYFPKGNFITGTIQMKSNVNIYLDRGAVIYGSTDLKDYPVVGYDYDALSLSWSQTVLIYASKAENITISGYGEINGMGDHPNFTVFIETPDFLLRPYMLRFVDCENIKVDGIKLSNSAYWVQHYLGCRQLTINNVTVDALSQHNNDGIDIDDCTDVVISNCIIQSEDDGICLKSNGTRGCKNISITNCVVRSSCNAIKLGTETTGGFDGVNISNCTISKPTNHHTLNGNPESLFAEYNPYDHPTYFGTAKALGGIVIESVDGAIVKNININNITMDDISTPIFIRLGFRGRKHVPHADAPTQGSIKGVIISGIIATSASPIASSIVGIPGFYVENVQLSNINYKVRTYQVEELQAQVPEQIDKYPSPEMFGMLPAHGFYLRHVKNIKFDNIQFTADSLDNRPVFYLDDAINTVIANSTFYSPSSSDLIQAKNSKNVVLKDCYSPLSYKSAFKDLGNNEGIYLLNNILLNTLSSFKTNKKNQIFVRGNLFR